MAFIIVENSIMKKLIFLSLILSSSSGAVLAQSTHEEIKDRLKRLSPLLGSWSVESKYESRNGALAIEKGMAQISWTLDSTYLKWTSTLTNSETGNQREYTSLITFDSSENAYRQTYFYSGSARIITEYGQWNEGRAILTTKATLNLPDGTVEQLRNEFSLENDKRLIYLSWAKFDSAPEVNNFELIMTRVH